MEGRVWIEPRWRGAELDRLLDADHAAIGRAVAARLETAGWQVMLEVTYAIGGEQGSVDVLAVQSTWRAALVVEIKSDVPSAEATGRKLDVKRRLAATIVRDRLGWTPAVVGAILVLPESTRLRDLLAGPARVLGLMFPIASRQVRAWLRKPSAPLAATWFLSGITLRNAPRVQRTRFAAPSPASRRAVVASSVESGDEGPPARILR